MLIDTELAKNFKIEQVADKHILQTESETALNHILVEGENLFVLDLLSKTYNGKIDVVYIDPPYNTGSTSMAYADKFIKSEWLGMMRSRLEYVPELMSPDGVIVISIDDKHYADLRLLCNDIFSEDNYVTTLVWQTKSEAKGIPPKNMCVVNHEYILVYSKNKDYKFVGTSRDLRDGFANPDDDPRGPWKIQYLQRFGQGFKQKKLINPKNGMQFTFESPYTQEKLNKWVEEMRILFPDKPNSYPGKKEFFSEYKNAFKPITSDLGLFNTAVSTNELKELFGGTKTFDYAKPVELMKMILKHVYPKDALILDFFAGSGTTMQAAIELNLKDNGKRQCILCTNNELGKQALEEAKELNLPEGSAEYEELGVCRSVTYPRLKAVLTGRRPNGDLFYKGDPNSNLFYYKVKESTDLSCNPELDEFDEGDLKFESEGGKQ